MKKFYFGILCCLLLLIANSGMTQSVWTQHNDQGRTGWFPYETELDVNNVNKNTFGFNFSHMTDDKIVSQPLVVMQVNIPNKGFKNIVIVTTLNNSVYAFDADENADAYWQTNFTSKIAPAPAATCSNCRPASSGDIHPDLCGGGYGDFQGNMGIVGTPVIDTLAGTIYFVTKIVNGNDPGFDNHTWVAPSSTNKYEEYTYPPNGFHQYLHAVDITTGFERPNSPVEINPTITGTGDGQSTSGIIPFNPRTQFNRAGLALSQGKVYIAFAAHCDNNPSHGWVVSYDASTLALANAYISTPNDGRGGIWMSGTAPAIDENGNIYFTTGNNLTEDPDPTRNANRIHIFPGILPSDPANRGESAVKLNPDLTLASYFTPFNYMALDDADKDFPIQVMLLPNTNLAMTGCKDGNFYIMDKANLGGFDPMSNKNKQTFFNGGTMHSSFAYFGGPTPYAYQFSEQTQLMAYPVTSNGLLTGSTQRKKNTVILGPSGGSGGYLSVSSNGADPNTGILWAYQAQNGCNANNNNCHGILHAVNASDISKTELWNSDMVVTDQVTIFNKFSCPTIARGKVFIAANKNQLFCYGLKTNTTCVNNIAQGKTVTASSGSGASNIVDGILTTSWTSSNQDANTISIDLGADYDICRIAITWSSGLYAKDFNVRISENGTTWTTFKTILGNTLNYTEFNSVVTTRYIQMQGVTRNATAYSINEIQVYGSLASDCRAPSGLTAVTRKSNTERISWDAVSGANTYTVKYRNNLSPEWLSRTVNTNTIDLTALACGNLYYYTVQADCATDPNEISSGAFSPRGCQQNNCDIFPVRYYSLDLGDIGMAGTTCKSGNIYSMSGSGTDIGGISDQFHFTFTNNDNADYEASGQLIQQDQVFPSNKLGIMVRDSLTSTSRFAYMASVNNGANFIFEYRDVAGGPVTTTTFPASIQNPWMKVAKTGTNYTGYISADDVNWNQLGASVDLHFGIDPANIPNYGMAVTSADNSGLSSGQIQSFSLDEVNSSPLPVKLVNFSAKAVNHDHVLVSWSTAMEHLADYFIILRSVDNKSFEMIDKIPAVGESQTPRYYSINDNKPAAGTNYYRLKEVDKDGNFYLSPIVSVKFDVPTGFEVFPNPAGDFTNINSLRDDILEIRLSDVTGKLLRSVQPGSVQTYRLNIAELPKGVYFISVKTKKSVYRQKLVKQ